MGRYVFYIKREGLEEFVLENICKADLDADDENCMDACSGGRSICALHGVQSM
jgi:hypothetical protein